MMRLAIFVILAVLTGWTQTTPLASQVDSVFPDARALYLDLHQHPELSSHETRTAATLAERLRVLGYEVTEHVGGNGLVAIQKWRRAHGDAPHRTGRASGRRKNGPALCQQGPYQG